MKKALAIIYSIIILSIIQYIKDIGFWMMVTTIHNQSPFPTYIGSLVVLLVLIILILLFSLFFRKMVKCNYIWQAGIVTGLIAFCLTFVFIWLGSLIVIQWHAITYFSFTSFIIGFLFPLLYRLFSRQALFNEHFY